MMRLSQVARKLNVGRNSIIDHLSSKGFKVDKSPNSKITPEQFDLLAKEFASSALDKEEAHELKIGQKHADNIVIEKGSETDGRGQQDEEKILIKSFRADEGAAETPAAESPATPKEKETKVEKSPEEKPEQKDQQTDSEEKVEKPKLKGVKVVGKIDLDKPKKEKEEEKKEPKAASEDKKESTTKSVEKETPPKAAEQPAKKEEEEDVIEAKAESLKGLKVVGKIDLPNKPSKNVKPVASSDDEAAKRKKKRPRKRISGAGGDKSRLRKQSKEEPSDQEIQDQIKKTLAKLSGNKGTVTRSKYRREKRQHKAEVEEEKILQEQENAKVLKVTEFISANDLASLMDISVNEIISKGMEMGMFISINQRLDAEAITMLTDEFDYDVQFITEEDEADIQVEEDDPKDLKDRAPIVTIMGHVDHGKTSLLDYIRDSKVTDSEAGGITQHIGAYDVMTESGKRIAFLDTPGHEAFTAMRARGAKITDVAIIVVAADDAVMPQTKEAINHAQIAGVPIVIAINKVDKPNANPEKIKEDLSNINILVEDWGGKYQSQDISAKTGQGIEDLLEKVLLEAELLELKANPEKQIGRAHV